MRTTEALLEFVLIGALALFFVLCAFLLEEVQLAPELANLLADKGFLGGGVYFALFLSVSYLLGLVVNTFSKKLFRSHDRWIRSIELQHYAGSLKFRKLIRALGLGIEDYECVDPLIEIGWLQKWLLISMGWALGPAAQANARTLERCYRVIGQLPFAAMSSSNAAHADISVQRATVRISRNSALVCAIAAAWLLVRAMLLGRSILWVSFITCAALAIGCFFSFLQRARWYALDSIKYALARAGDGEERKIAGVVIDLGGVLTRDIREALFADLISAHPPLREVAGKVSDVLWDRAARRTMTYEDFWDALRLEVESRLKDFPPLFLSNESLNALSDRKLKCNETIYSLLEECHVLGVPVVACSNMTSFWMESLEKRFQLKKLFVDLVLSCDHGTVKPAPRLIEFAVSRLQMVTDSTIVFIDDREENCRAAQRVGLQPVLFRSSRVLRRTLRGFGLPLAWNDRADEWVDRHR